MGTTDIKSMNYIGSSMNPTLESGVRLDVSAYHGQKIRKGDVVVFIPPGGDSKIVHRVISINSDGIRTRGDNRKHEDNWVLKRENILGRVVTAQKNNKRRRIFGGPLGRLFAATVRVIYAMDLPVSHLLRPAYNELAKVSIFTRLLPARMRPRVLSFKRDAGTELHLVMGGRVIGRWLPGRTRWHIRRPFRLFVDEETLPGNPGKGLVVSCPSSVADEDL
jgi:signal peptidase